jgi:Zn-dependent protease with chaperone function
VAAGISSEIQRRTTGWPVSRVAGVLLLLKLAPGLIAIFFTCVVFLPAHWRFEPEGVEESPGYTLFALASLGAAALALAGRRAIRAARLTHRLERGWHERASGPRAFVGGRLPVYCLPDDAPVISLAGLLRPRVFVARPIAEALTSDEMDVSLAHELAHHDSRDNLKRVLVACSTDLLAVWPSGRALERRWRASVEFAADARAVGGSPKRAVALASALLRVARLAPAAGVPAVGSAFYDGTLLSARIDRLLAPSLDGRPPHRVAPAWSMSLGSMTLLAAALAGRGVWLGVHLATEGLVRFLP